MHDQTIDSLQQCVAVYSFSETGLCLVLNGSTTWKWGWRNQKYSLNWGGREGGRDRAVLHCKLHTVGHTERVEFQKGATYSGCDKFKRVPPTLGATNFKRVPPTLGATNFKRVPPTLWVRQRGSNFKREPPTLWVRLRGSNSKGHHLHWVRQRSNWKGHHLKFAANIWHWKWQEEQMLSQLLPNLKIYLVLLSDSLDNGSRAVNLS